MNSWVVFTKTGTFGGSKKGNGEDRVSELLLVSFSWVRLNHFLEARHDWLLSGAPSQTLICTSRVSCWSPQGPKPPKYQLDWQNNSVLFNAWARWDYRPKHAIRKKQFEQGGTGPQCSHSFVHCLLLPVWEHRLLVVCTLVVAYFCNLQSTWLFTAGRNSFSS